MRTLDGPLTLRIERGVLAEKAREEKHPVLLLPLGPSIVTLKVEANATRLDRSTFALVPAHIRHRVIGMSPVMELLSLRLGEGVMQAAAREYRPHVEMSVFSEIVAHPRVLTRTRWVDEVAQRYLFERDVCEKHTTLAARFLEMELVKELYFLGKESLANQSRASVLFEGDDVVARAREAIEAKLFEPLRVSLLAKQMHVSESTLLRAFRRELGVTPAAYQRERRLDEAVLLLGSGRFGVGEVATRVGYGHLAAFTVAFRRRFGHPPSEARVTARVDALSPSGAPDAARTGGKRRARKTKSRKH